MHLFSVKQLTLVNSFVHCDSIQYIHAKHHTVYCQSVHFFSVKELTLVNFFVHDGIYCDRMQAKCAYCHIIHLRQLKLQYTTVVVYTLLQKKTFSGPLLFS